MTAVCPLDSSPEEGETARASRECGAARAEPDSFTSGRDTVDSNGGSVDGSVVGGTAGVGAGQEYSRYSRQDSSDINTDDEGAAVRRLTPLERLNLDMCQDDRVVRELTIGRRIGFYKIRGEIGCDKVAIKILDKTKLDQKTQRLLSREISSMEKLHHPNIIRLYEVVETLSRLHLVMEYAGGGELYTKISTEGNFPTPAFMFSYCLPQHENNVIHRDLKAENVFYTSGSCVKVGDFGFSTLSRRDETLNTFCGSPPYAAPELFRDEHYVGIYVDIWALGVMLFFMVTGTMPFRADTVPKLKRCILEGAYVLPPCVSEPCQRLIRGILQPVPCDRSTVEQMMGCEWLLPVDFPRAMEPFKLDPYYLEKDVKASLENLGITSEHILNNQGKDCRSSITGVYRILLHRAHKRRAVDIVPVVSQVAPNTSAKKKERLKFYRNLRHTSKLCVIL
uniref:non-specific serine/threonine protein kinase n=1 Tax=Neogobius melanostomus TaxID=47308 RepID=A0A8C6ULC1_9GOBI